MFPIFMEICMVYFFSNMSHKQRFFSLQLIKIARATRSRRMSPVHAPRSQTLRSRTAPPCGSKAACELTPATHAGRCPTASSGPACRAAAEPPPPDPRAPPSASSSTPPAPRASFSPPPAPRASSRPSPDPSPRRPAGPAPLPPRRRRRSPDAQISYSGVAEADLAQVLEASSRSWRRRRAASEEAAGGGLVTGGGGGGGWTGSNRQFSARAVKQQR
ncbi:hypothetical protein BS78_05G035600 [Paspalum vaginatum]|nr:hypothetical protein BS78_05G035600 [Paspalum vaginatum]